MDLSRIPQWPQLLLAAEARLLPGYVDLPAERQREIADTLDLLLAKLSIEETKSCPYLEEIPMCLFRIALLCSVWPVSLYDFFRCHNLLTVFLATYQEYLIIDCECGDISHRTACTRIYKCTLTNGKLRCQPPISRPILSLELNEDKGYI